MKDSILKALTLHVENGAPCGDFVTAVLANDLSAVAKADDQNLADIVEIFQYVHNELPANCHGSPEMVSMWRSVGGLAGMRKRGMEWSKETGRFEKVEK